MSPIYRIHTTSSSRYQLSRVDWISVRGWAQIAEWPLPTSKAYGIGGIGILTQSESFIQFLIYRISNVFFLFWLFSRRVFFCEYVLSVSLLISPGSSSLASPSVVGWELMPVAITLSFFYDGWVALLQLFGTACQVSMSNPITLRVSLMSMSNPIPLHVSLINIRFKLSLHASQMCHQTCKWFLTGLDAIYMLMIRVTCSYWWNGLPATGNYHNSRKCPCPWSAWSVCLASFLQCTLSCIM